MSVRRKLVLLLVAGAGVLVALAGAAVTSAGGLQEKTLNIYGFGSGFGRGDDVANSLTEYASGRLGNQVNYDNPRGGFNDQAFLAMLAARDVPDVMWMSRGLIGTYAARGALQPLNSCIRRESIPMKQYRKAAVREVTYRGQIYAIPAFTNPITIIVNNDVARQAGVKIADISTTNWKKLRQANKKMLRTSGGRVTRIGFDPKIPEFFPLWVKWFGADLISKDGLRARLNSPQAIQALNFTLSLINDHGGFDRFQAFRQTHNWFGRNNPIAENQIGATPYESFIYNVIANNSPNVNLTAKFFTNRRGAPITIFSGNGWAIPRGARDADVACRWAKHMTAVPAWVTAARNRLNIRRRSGEAFTGLYTANTVADVRIFEDVYQPVGKKQWDVAVQRLVQSQRYAFALPPSPASAEFRQAYIDAINRVLAGRQSVRAALNQAQREAQEAINRNRRR